MTADKIYHDLVAKAGLYGKAFFGHKATRREKKTLERFWKRAQRLAGGNHGY